MNQRFRLSFLFLLCTLLSLSSCKKDETIIPPTHELSDVSAYNAKNAIDWVNVFRKIVTTQNINPPRAARVYAYAGITLYESVVDGIKNNKSLQGQLNGFALHSIPENTDSLDYDIVLNEALFLIAQCDTIIPSLTSENKDSVLAIHDRVLLSKTGMVEDSIVTKSKARGVVVANAIKQYAASDNFLTVKTLSYIVPEQDADHLWYWQKTDDLHPNPVEPHWGKIRPFVMDSAAQFEIPQMVLFSTDTSSAFGRQAREVYLAVGNKTTEQNNTVLWWRDQSGTQTPAGHWMGILQYIIHLKNFKLDKAAELYALVGITTADAFISCWDAKYKYNLLRPETYIRAYMNPSWTTGQGSDITPPFPEYPSGHSVCSGAASKVLTDALGTFAFKDSINVALGYAPRSFTSFFDAADEAAASRLYGGIHFREAITSGIQEGRNIGQKVTNTLHFR